MTDGERMIWAAVFAIGKVGDLEPAVRSANWAVTRIRKALADATKDGRELPADMAMLAEMVC